MTTDVVEPKSQAPTEVVEAKEDRERLTEIALAEANNNFAATTAMVLATPGIPGRDEFLSMAMQARTLSLSAAAPKGVRDNPAVALHIVLLGRDLGLSPTAALELIDLIPDRDGMPRPSLSPQLLNARIRRLGLGAIKPVKGEWDNWHCLVRAFGPDYFEDPRCGRQHWPWNLSEDLREGVPTDAECKCRGIEGELEFTMDDARTATLVDSRCKPETGSHWRPTNGAGKCQCRQGYITYPRNMLFWRSSAMTADVWFPEASLGLYSPEALDALVDEDGRPMDPATAELPPGYGPSEAPAAEPWAYWGFQSHDSWSTALKSIRTDWEIIGDIPAADVLAWVKTELERLGLVQQGERWPVADSMLTEYRRQLADLKVLAKHRRENPTTAASPEPTSDGTTHDPNTPIDVALMDTLTVLLEELQSPDMAGHLERLTLLAGRPIERMADLTYDEGFYAMQTLRTALDKARGTQQ